MGVAIDSTGFQVVPLTTLERVREFWTPSKADTSVDPLIEKAIEGVSADLTRRLGYHTLRATRTETYAINQGRKLVDLDARPVVISTVTDVRQARHPSLLDAATACDVTDYYVDSQAALLRFSQSVMYRPQTFVRLTYEGGVGVDFAGVLAADEELVHMATLQTAYLMTRRSTLGGNITVTQGVSTGHRRDYRLQQEVFDYIRAHQRGGFVS